MAISGLPGGLIIYTYAPEVWSHVFQSAHRWAHWPPDALPGPVRALQTAGLVLTHSRRSVGIRPGRLGEVGVWSGGVRWGE